MEEKKEKVKTMAERDSRCQVDCGTAAGECGWRPKDHRSAGFALTTSQTVFDGISFWGRDTR